MGNKTYIWLTVVIILLVFTSTARAKTEEKPPVQSREATQIDQNSEPNGEMTYTFRGLVTDKLGRPRGNVYIAPQPTNIRGIRSNTQGRFTLEDVKPDQKNWIAYSQASQAIGLFTITEDYAGQPIHVSLNFREAEAEGRVVDSDGQGLADRKVELVIKTNRGLTYRFPCYGKTDQYGNYSHGLIPCGSGLSIQARLADANEVEQKCVTKAVSLSDDQIFIPMPRLVIGQGQPKDTDDGRILCSGRVLNEEFEPIEGVKVRLYYYKGDRRWSGGMVTTDEQGRWRRRLPANYSGLSIRLSHPEYISYHFDRSSRTPSKQELLNGTNVMVMKQGLWLRGLVKNQQGEPIENALVAAGRLYSRSPYGELIEDSTTARTPAEGTFIIGGLPKERIDVLCSATGYAPKIMPVEIKEKMEPLDVVLKGGKTYVERVVDANGNPIEAVKIDVREWRIGNKRKAITRITETDSKGFFRIENLPEEGKLKFHFGKRGSGFESFSKVMPEDISQIDQIVMYKTPVFTGKVIDAETEKPVTSFKVVNGVKWKSTDESFRWSRRYKKQVDSEDGAFSETWSGYAVSYPFDGDCCLKIEAKGYLPKMAPPIKLGEKYEPFVIRLTKADPWKGTVVKPTGNPAAKAEVGWVGPGKKAFIQDGKFDRRGFVYQAEVIVRTDENGQFELNPTREQGLIVVVHSTGYAHVESSDFDNGSQIQLTPWAKIEGTIVSSDKDSREFIVAVAPIMSSEDDKSQLISWQFEQISVSGRHFVIDYLPSIPLHVGQIVRWEHSSPVYLKPQAGETYKVQIGGKGRTVIGKIIHPIPERAKETGEAGMSNPRRLHAVAHRIEPVSKMPDEIENMSQSSFLWLWRDAENVYERSKTFEKRFIPTIEDDGNFRFDNIPPGKYEFVVNYHAPLGENVSCGRGVLEAVAITKFNVDTDDTESVQLPDVKMRLLTYPEVGDPAPLFEAESFDGKTIRLEDFWGKVVLLDFWATWCRPCVDEIPKTQDIYNTFATDERFVMIGMSLDWELDKAKKFVEEKGLNWPQVCLGDMSKSIVVKQYEIGGIPSTILIGPDGKITAKNLVSEQLKLAIAKALGN